MAIIKHIPSQNRNFSDVITYLTMQHDESSGAVILDTNGEMLERENYLIQGIHCTPDDYAELCLRDRFRFGIKAYESEVITHQYVLSFAPNDAACGLTVEMAQAEGVRFARKYFPGHRAIVCTHPDGASHSGNIHIHIVISALRFEDRIPEESYMRLRGDGSVKPSEYKAGCRHQDTARLRLHMKAHLQEYCRLNGFAVAPSRAEKKINNREYKAGIKAQARLEQDNALRMQNGVKPAQAKQLTHKEELRRVIADAAATSVSWDAFCSKLQTGYTRPVEHRAGTTKISYPEKKKLWSTYKDSKQNFWNTHKALADSYSLQLEDVFQRLRNHRQNRPKTTGKRTSFPKDHDAITKDLRDQIAAMKSKQQKLRLISKVYQTYSKAAALALNNAMEDDARICLARMEELTGRLEGRWKDGWQCESSTHSLINGRVQSRITWLQTQKEELTDAEKILNKIQEAVQQAASNQPEITEEPFPVDVKLTHGVISFKHPDMEHWVRGKTLGSAYEWENIIQKLKPLQAYRKTDTRW